MAASQAEFIPSPLDIVEGQFVCLVLRVGIFSRLEPVQVVDGAELAYRSWYSAQQMVTLVPLTAHSISGFSTSLREDLLSLAHE